MLRYKILADGTSIMVRSLDELITVWKQANDRTALEDAVKLRDHLIRKAHYYDGLYTQWVDEQLALSEMSGTEEETPRTVNGVGEDSDLQGRATE